MLDRPPKRMDQHTFWSQATLTLFAIVLVYEGRGSRFHTGVASYFDTNFPGLFSFGTLNSRRIPAGEWWKSNFRTSMGALRPRGEPAEPGYYLLEQGFVVGHVRTAGQWDTSATAHITSHLGRLAEARRPAEDPWGGTPLPPERVVAPEPLDDPYEMLEIGSSASEDEIRDAYRAAMKLNHPDRVAHMSQAIQDFAKDRTVKIHQAYEAILAWRKHT